MCSCTNIYMYIQTYVYDCLRCFSVSPCCEEFAGSAALSLSSVVADSWNSSLRVFESSSCFRDAASVCTTFDGLISNDAFTKRDAVIVMYITFPFQEEDVAMYETTNRTGTIFEMGNSSLGVWVGIDTGYFSLYVFLSLSLSLSLLSHSPLHLVAFPTYPHLLSCTNRGEFSCSGRLGS